MALVMSLLAAGIAGASAYSEGNIYPAGFFEHSTGLTVENFDDFIKEGVDADKTVFVRWIASEG